MATRAVKAGSARPKLAPGAGTTDTGSAGTGSAGTGSPGPSSASPVRKRPALVPPGWVPITSTILCLIAFADSAYLAFIHYTNPAGLACSTHGFINCTAVTTSIYSHPFGIPVVDAGLVWCFGMLLLCSPWGWRASSRWVSPLRLAGSVAGVGMVFYLLYVELFELGHLCEYCSVVHLMTIALFIVVAFGTALATPGDEEDADEMDDVAFAG